MAHLSDLLSSVFGSARETPSPTTSIFNTHRYLVDFYNEKVCVKQDHHAKLRDYRRACLRRLREGLRQLGEKRYREYRSYKRVHNQGSYAMGTLNQHPKNAYDIDVAVIFKKEDLPTTALKARQLVADALRAPLHNFAIKPLARTNAVTVWYGEGQHVDLAVYREVTDSSGSSYLEHAGSEWRRRHPREITRWFFRQNKARSPAAGPGTAVPKGQFRRVVRLIKSFARSRLSWHLPGGLILSALISEVYRPHAERDDVALYETLVALQARLRKSTEVRYPVPPENLLTSKPEFAAQVKRLLEKLDFVLPHLDTLKDPACLEFQALRAWNWVFHHNYWSKQARDAEIAALVEPAALQVRAGLADGKGDPIRVNCRGSTVVASKGTWLRFSPKRGLEPERPFVVRWTLAVGGHEATTTEECRPEHSRGAPEFWAEAKAPGRHSVSCELIKDGKVLAQGIRHFRVVSG